MFELSEGELASADRYEPAGYKRISTKLASGKQAWVYAAAPNVQQAVPFFSVTDIESSLRFFVDGLGFAMTMKWAPKGRVRWCWLQLGEAAVMLQEYWRDGRPAGAPAGPLGQGVSVCFMCADAIAIYHEVTSRGLAASRPFVGNGLWVTSVQDPDGYRLEFESPTDVPEETECTRLDQPRVFATTRLRAATRSGSGTFRSTDSICRSRLLRRGMKFRVIASGVFGFLVRPRTTL